LCPIPRCTHSISLRATHGLYLGLPPGAGGRRRCVHAVGGRVKGLQLLLSQPARACCVCRARPLCLAAGKLLAASECWPRGFVCGAWRMPVLHSCESCVMYLCIGTHTCCGFLLRACMPPGGLGPAPPPALQCMYGLDTSSTIAVQLAGWCWHSTALRHSCSWASPVAVSQAHSCVQHGREVV